MVGTLRQGDIYWVDGISVSLTELGGRRPVVVTQGNRLNESRIRTVIVSTLTSNLERANDIGNVLLDDGEANLSKRSVVNVSQFHVLDKADLVEYIGTLGAARVREIVAGIALTFAVVAPTETPEKPDAGG